jgi:hypothetical protein
MTFFLRVTEFDRKRRAASQRLNIATTQRLEPPSGNLDLGYTLIGGGSRSGGGRTCSFGRGGTRPRWCGATAAPLRIMALAASRMMQVGATGVGMLLERASNAFASPSPLYFWASAGLHPNVHGCSCTLGSACADNAARARSCSGCAKAAQRPLGINASAFLTSCCAVGRMAALITASMYASSLGSPKASRTGGFTRSSNGSGSCTSTRHRPTDCPSPRLRAAPLGGPMLREINAVPAPNPSRALRGPARWRRRAMRARADRRGVRPV